MRGPPGTVDENGVLWKSTRVGEFVSDPGNGVRTIWDMLVRSCEEHKDRPGVGWREVLTRETVGENGKRHELLTLSPTYQWLTYAKLFDTVENLASGLVAATGLHAGDRMVIFCETSKEWLMAASAAWRQNISVVTIYATLGVQGVLHSLSQTKASVIVCHANLLHVIQDVLPQAPHVQHVVVVASDAVSAPLDLGRVKAHRFEQLSDGSAPTVPASPPSADDTAVIMYTSGTTGVPKGVVIKQKQVVAMMAGITTPGASLMNATPPINKEDVYMAYLPMAHIFELACELAMIMVGMAIGYGHPHTLTSTGVRFKQTQPAQVGDAAALRPTMLIVAPAVLDKVYATVRSRVAGKSSVARALFHRGMAVGFARYDKGGVGAGGIYDALIFKSVKALLGSRVRIMIAGSAPLAPDVQKFVQTCFGCPVRQGYGLTETCAGTCFTLMDDNSTSVVGPPEECACIRLRDWEEGGYRNADAANPEIGMRRGEILVGGPAVCEGYFVPKVGTAMGAPRAQARELEHLNQTHFVVIDGVRYFCTGDIGQITRDGNLQIIDRKKDLVKLQQGEYVALSKVENVLKNSKYTAIPMVHAMSSKAYCIALVCPQVSALRNLATDLQVPVSDSLETLCANPKVVEAVLADLQKECKSRNLASFEMPKKLVLVAEAWSVENDLLTGTLKVKRKEVVAKHQAEIDAVYS